MKPLQQRPAGRLGLALGALIASAGAVSTVRAGDLAISVNVAGEVAPGVYGEVNIGNNPAPRLVYAQPVVIVPAPVAVPVEPIYLHVPPGHARHWRRHCHEYHACNRPVYFVWSREYEPDYQPEYAREREHEHWHGHDEDEEHGHHRGHRDHDD